ncbi:fimbrillin family protein [Bacteroides pyogenes]|jgi:hypothetical protein|uniref:Fimbrillin family protein n=1 Tax=Bacteroides pyogenes TaxID=310300 RepID=A0A5D3E9K9_9BACE|nr:fimbrillin family protein [Bacteroides pyogenes]TYK32847.1 fimbrillin family protein [Bacteroides pyogenes]
MKKQTSILLFVLFCFSCTEKEHGSVAELHISGKTDILSRGAAKNVFASGDEIGIFISESNGSVYEGCPCNINAKATYRLNTWEMDHKVLLFEREAVVYAYYPYRITTVPTLSVRMNEEDYLLSYPVMVSAANPDARLSFRHLMTLLEISIEKGEYLGKGELSSFRIENIPLSGIIDLTQGTIIHDSFSSEEFPQQAILKNTPLILSALVIPAHLQAARFVFTVDGREYSYLLPVQDWISGRRVRYTLSLDSGKILSLAANEIAAWDSSESYTGKLELGKFR